MPTGDATVMVCCCRGENKRDRLAAVRDSVKARSPSPGKPPPPPNAAPLPEASAGEGVRLPPLEATPLAVWGRGDGDALRVAGGDGQLGGSGEPGLAGEEVMCAGGGGRGCCDAVVVVAPAPEAALMAISPAFISPKVS